MRCELRGAAFESHSTKSRGMMMSSAKRSAPKQSAGWSLPSFSLPSFGSSSKASAPDSSMMRSKAKPASRAMLVETQYKREMKSSMQSMSMSMESSDNCAMMSSACGSVGMSAAPQMAMACESSSSSYYQKPDFRDIVNGIKSNGVMTDKILQYVTVYNISAMINK